MAMAAAALISSATAPAAAYPFPNVDFTGHGWGHGRGMGQYGAYGYALQGKPYTWILDHFYGGTTLSTSSALIYVNLSAFDGFDTITQMTNAHLLVSWNGGSLPGAQKAVRVHHNPDGSLSVATNPTGCGGTWGAPVGVSGSDVTIGPQLPGNDINEMVQACTPDGSYHWYRGSIVTKGASTQSWNLLAVDDYVRGVVPRESPASWGTSGGEEALKAQAVAARSYGLASVLGGGAICDSTSCQVYGGRAVQDSGGYRDLEGAGIYLTTTDAAVVATALQVRLCTGSTGCPAGSVAHTEFSSSTGGYTAGGAFPSVVDDGDATPSNPNHTWTTSVPVSTVQAAFGSIGVLQSVSVIKRNGLGDLGGRVLQVRLTGSAGSVVVSGDELEGALGLQSNWFAVTNAVTGPSGGDNGYWLLGDDGGIFTFGAAGFYGSTGGMHLNRPVRGMAPTPSQLGYWLVASDGGIFSFGDARFFGSMGAVVLNQPVVGMAATPAGRGYWLVASDGGIFSFGDAKFLGSMGAVRLNQPVVGMAATPTGRGYWMVASDGGIFSFGDAGFYGSMGAVRLDQPIVGMVPTSDGRGYLLVGRDGGIFAFGDAHFEGSLPGQGVRDTVMAAQPTVDALGYLMVGASGSVYNFGDAPWFGGMPEAVPGYQGTIIGLRTHQGN
jgi:SpoIID/LytB domain protein